MEKEFTQLLNTHRGLIYKVCNLYCSSQEDKQDLFQEIVLQLWKSYATFNENKGRFSTWLYRVALNTAITHHRKEQKKPRSVYLEHIQIPEPADPGLDSEDIRLLYKAIEQLSPVEKAVILLYLDGKSYEEIAEITGITRTNAGVKLNRTRQKLDKIFKTIS
ncbi:RNA polymerase sigma factor [Filimonas effusa]|uniref:Sigma-70 family RNA polymerase sigma factor n=1 Tax=Filimonas effusa TaxID=2508721 RepID=A0A4Q1D042_9BACT|nr:sigma-70 family RNA polymerase sigma factor [Filimonas effusa]RXK81033.1 sigma-70 family RNA polymerase sigma factor [Filimonas effusa]